MSWNASMSHLICKLERGVSRIIIVQWYLGTAFFNSVQYFPCIQKITRSLSFAKMHIWKVFWYECGKTLERETPRSHAVLDKHVGEWLHCCWTILTASCMLGKKDGFIEVNRVGLSAENRHLQSYTTLRISMLAHRLFTHASAPAHCKVWETHKHKHTHIYIYIYV